MPQIFDQTELFGAVFRNLNMEGARFEGAWLKGAAIAHSCLRNVTMTAVDVGGLTIDGIRIDHLLEAERDRRDPCRVGVRITDPHDPADVRRAVAVAEGVRQAFTAHLRAAPAAQLTFKPPNRRWSAIDHLRHVLFAEELYTCRWILRQDTPFTPQGLLPHFLLDKPAYAGVGREPAASAGDLDLLLAAWAAVHARTMACLAEATPQMLSRSVKDVSFGQADVGAVFRTFTGHDLHHIRLAEAAMEAWRGAGN